MAKTITSANASIVLTIAGVLAAPTRLRGFGTDNIFSTETIKRIEVQMGIDGHLSAGFVFKEVVMSITLQADSPSMDVFDNWDQAGQLAGDAFEAQGIITLPAIKAKFTLVRGFLTDFAPAPDAEKTLKPRKFGITWEKMIKAAA